MIPINTSTVDYVSWVTAAIQQLVTSGGTVFQVEGTRLLTALGIIMLVIFGLKAAASVLSHRHAQFDLPGAIHFLALFIIAETMLRFYNAPLPWGGSSISSILPDTARQYAAWIDLTALDTLSSRITTILTGAQQPGALEVFMVPVYYATVGFLVVVQGLLFAMTVLGFVALGIGTVCGPLFIPWLLVPRMAWLFWNWISFMLQYSFYKVIASALTFIWANVIVTFIDKAIAGNYTLGHFLLLFPAMALLLVAMLFSIFKVTSFVSDLFKGTAAAGDGISGAFGTAVRGTFA
jgi:hypothetical protein